MRILQVTGLQIPLTRVVSIWRKEKRKKQKHDHNSDVNKALLLSLLKIQRNKRNVILVSIPLFLSRRYKESRKM